jgi:hypothetical protein
MRLTLVISLCIALGAACAAGAPKDVGRFVVSRADAGARASDASAVDAGAPQPDVRGDVLGILYDHPEIVDHAPLHAADPIDVTPFLDSRCTSAASHRPLDCLRASIAPLAPQADCTLVFRLPPEAGALSPRVPIVGCLVDVDESDGGATGMLVTGCMRRSARTWIVYDDATHALHHLRTPRELASFFAPVDSLDEALALAMALTATRPLYFPPGALDDARYYAPRVEATHVDARDDGSYRVHLFDYGACGCGPHPYAAVDVIVRRDGTVSEGRATPAFAHTRDDRVCID